MPSSLTTRLQRLEARRPPVAALPSTPPEFPPGWCEEVLRLLQEYGYLRRCYACSGHMAVLAL